MWLDWLAVLQSNCCCYFVQQVLRPSFAKFRLLHLHRKSFAGVLWEHGLSWRFLDSTRRDLDVNFCRKVRRICQLRRRLTQIATDAPILVLLGICSTLWLPLLVSYLWSDYQGYCVSKLTLESTHRYLPWFLQHLVEGNSMTTKICKSHFYFISFALWRALAPASLRLTARD